MVHPGSRNPRELQLLDDDSTDDLAVALGSHPDDGLDRAPILRGRDHRRTNPKRKVRVLVRIAAALAVLAGVIALVVVVGLRHPRARSGAEGTGAEGDHHPGEVFDVVHEAMFARALSPEHVRATARDFSSRVHFAGVGRNAELAERMAGEMRGAGFDRVEVQQYDVFLRGLPEGWAERATSDWVTVAVVEPEDKRYTCELDEPLVASDSTADGSVPQAPPFNGFSASGDVTGPLVYANAGRRVDFEELDRRGIDLTGAVVIVRYLHGFRGNKVKQAEQRGAAAVLLYSDPADDGAGRGEVYPNGPWRPEGGIQRGVVWTGDGDPSTPGWSSFTFHEGLLAVEPPRLNVTEMSDADVMLGDPLPKIPVQPLSARDARHLLGAISVDPEHPLPVDDSLPWQGGISGVQYAIGGGALSPQVRVRVDNGGGSVQPIFNACGVIDGLVEPDRMVVLGNHRDAWCTGMGDPSSGSVVMVEVVAGFKALLESGWRPRRSIMMCSWDAEEYGLIGSMEHVETHLNQLQAQAVAYLNVDVAVSGSQFKASGVPSLGDLVREAADSTVVGDAAEGRTVRSMWRNGTGKVEAIGSGSDYVGFLHRAGVPVVDVRFESSDDRYEAVYHSNYDSFDWMERFADPDWSRHTALANLLGSLALRLSSELVLPLDYADYGADLAHYTNLYGNDTGVRDGHVDLTPLRVAVQRFIGAANALHNDIRNLVGDDADASTEGVGAERFVELRIRQLNDRLMLAERALVDKTWTKVATRSFLNHVVFSPGRFDTYSGKAFQELGEALRAEAWPEAQRQVGWVAGALMRAAVVLRGDPLVT